MFGPDVLLECPVCRCRLQVPPRGGQVAYTCRNGHRFLHDFSGGSRSWPARHPRLTFGLLALVLLVLLVVRQWAHLAPMFRTT